MFNFFIDKADVNNGKAIIKGKDYNHIKNVLRMKEGEEILLSYDKTSSLAKISQITEEIIVCNVVYENYANTELPVNIHLFQGLPKSDKLELIIQKAVELGVSTITPVEMSRSIVKIEDKKKASKVERWQAISESAAKQSKRTVIPKVLDIIPYKLALEKALSYEHVLVPYENEKGMIETDNALNAIKAKENVAIFIGPEGGFSDEEIALAKEKGAKIISLGKRILRTETAAITAISMVMLHVEINL